MLRGKIVLDIYSIRFVNIISSFSGNPDVNLPIPGGWQAYWSPDGCRTGYRQLLPEVLIPWWEWRSGVSRGELPWRRPPETAHNISASCKTTQNFPLVASRTQLKNKQMHEEFESVSYDLLCTHTHSYLSKRFNSLYQTEANYDPRRQETQGQSPVEAPHIV